MKSIIKIFLYCGVLYLLAACAGGQGSASPDGLGGSGVGPVGGGQGQPTIAPGADHQGPTPVEPGDEKPEGLAIPDPDDEPEEPGPGQGATDFKSN